MAVVAAVVDSHQGRSHGAHDDWLMTRVLRFGWQARVANELLEEKVREVRSLRAELKSVLRKAQAARGEVEAATNSTLARYSSIAFCPFCPLSL